MPTTYHTLGATRIVVSGAVGAGGLAYSNARLIGEYNGLVALRRNPRPYAETADADDLIYCPMDEGGIAALFVDLVGAWVMGIATDFGANNWRTYHGTPMFVPTFTRRGIVANFDFGAANTAWTIDIVMRPCVHPAPIVPAHQTLVAFSDSVAPINQVGIRWMSATRQVRLDVNGVTANTNATSANTIVTQDIYQHLRLIIEAAQSRLYVNGALVATAAAVSGFVGGPLASLEVGFGAWIAGYVSNAALCSFRISRVVRTPTEVVSFFTQTFQDAVADPVLISSLPNYVRPATAFVDLALAESGATGGEVRINAQVDGGAAQVLATANAVGRTTVDISGLNPATSLAVWPSLRSTNGTSPGLAVTSFGFSYLERSGIYAGVPGGIPALSGKGE